MMKFVALFFLFVICRQVNAYDDGSCFCKQGKVSSLGKNGSEACQNARENCESKFVDFCGDDCECNATSRKCKKGATITKGFPIEVPNSFDKKFKCEVNCLGKDFKCVKPGGKKDPHFTDFNGKHFDFHGEGGGKYVMFGRQDGDVLVSRMVEKFNTDPLTNTVNKKTFFDQFGIRISSGKKVTISHGLRPNGLEKTYRTIVSVDGSNVERDFVSKGLSISFHEDYRNVEVKTEEMSYFFEAFSKKNNEHLDFHMSLQRTPQVTDRYVGVLGMSLNTKIGHEVRTPLTIPKGYDKDAWEKTLRKEFGVSTLHPYSSKAFKMHGIVRMSQIPLTIHGGNSASASMDD